MKKKQIKHFVIQKESTTNEGFFQGIASTAQVDLAGDIIEPGAFRKSIQENKRIRLLWQHDTAQPIGSVKRLYEDADGLKFEAQLNLEVQKAREALALLRAGDIDGISVGFIPIKYEPDRTNGGFRIKEAKLLELSLVTFPCNEGASVTSVKSELIDRCLELLDEEAQMVLLHLVSQFPSLKDLEPVPHEATPARVDREGEAQDAPDHEASVILALRRLADELAGESTSEGTHIHHSSTQADDTPGEDELIQALSKISFDTGE